MASASEWGPGPSGGLHAVSWWLHQVPTLSTYIAAAAGVPSWGWFPDPQILQIPSQDEPKPAVLVVRCVLEEVAREEGHRLRMLAHTVASSSFSNSFERQGGGDERSLLPTATHVLCAWSVALGWPKAGAGQLQSGLPWCWGTVPSTRAIPGTPASTWWELEGSQTWGLKPGTIRWGVSR